MSSNTSNKPKLSRAQSAAVRPREVDWESRLHRNYGWIFDVILGQPRPVSYTLGFGNKIIYRKAKGVLDYSSQELDELMSGLFPEMKKRFGGDSPKSRDAEEPKPQRAHEQHDFDYLGLEVLESEES